MERIGPPKLEDVKWVAGDVISFAKTTDPFQFTVKLKLHTGERRTIGTLKAPKYDNSSVIFEVRRVNYEHYMRKVGGYGFNYALMDYLVKKYPRVRVMVRLFETDTSDTFYINVKDMLGKNIVGYTDKKWELNEVMPSDKETILRFKEQGFELQIFRKTSDYVDDTKNYMAYLDKCG